LKIKEVKAKSKNLRAAH